MGKEYSNELRGVLFKNDRKQQETHPDYKGSVQVEGNEYWLSAWIKDGPKGKFMSLSLTPKEQHQQMHPTKQMRRDKPKQQNRQDEPFIDDDLDSIPF